MANKIALEEHFLCPGFEDYWKATVADVDPNILKQVVARLSDFGEQRLKSMDSAGITRAVLGLTGPPAHTTAESSPCQLISRLSSSSVALIGLGWLITRPNEPLSPCSIISTTAREKLGSASCGIASRRPGARLADSTTP